ncbi:MAG: hypothetical protein WCA91_18145 [Candidatus Acidiferrales bacterium]
MGERDEGGGAHEYGGPEKLKFEDNVPAPKISGSTVLIASAAASVNPIDWKVRSGMRQKDFPLSFPAILDNFRFGMGDRFEGGGIARD